ncbi:unnamed protein product [Musa acuminata subsp. burmannicoides]
MLGVGCTSRQSIAVGRLTTSNRGGAIRRLTTSNHGGAIRQSSFLCRPVAPNEAGVAAASPSSMDVGGGEIPITTEELEAFLASSSSSVDLGGEQNCTDDAFFAESLKPCRCRMTPTQPRLQTRRPHRQPL